MKENNLYPRLPTAPPIEDQGQGYRLQKNKRNSSVSRKGSCDKRKYFRAARIVDKVDTILIVITLGGGA